MALLAVLVALAWTRVPKAASPPPPAKAPGPRGTLVYAAVAGDGSGDSLWKLDLLTDTADRGPAVPPVRDISDASLGGPYRIGLTVDGPGDSVAAMLLRGVGAREHPVDLGRGSLVAWGPGGAEVAIANREPGSGRCAPASIDVVDVGTGAISRPFSRDRMCGDLISLGRDGQTTYFTRYSNGHASIFYVSLGIPHRVLNGYVMLSVSPASDFLVARFRPKPASDASRQTLLFWPGTGSPVPFGSASAPDRLLVDRTLAWSRDASEALVAGTLGSESGVYLIGVGPSGAEKAPVRVASEGGSIGAVFAEDGTAYLAIDGRILRYSNGTTEPVALPAGAPPPAGPLAWLP